MSKTVKNDHLELRPKQRHCFVQKLQQIQFALTYNEILVSERLEFGNVWHLSPQDLNDLCGIVRLIISAVAVTQEKTVFEGVCDMTNGFQGKFFLECCFQ